MIFNPGKIEGLRERIPLYVNKRLSEKESREFEEALNQYPELKEELKEFYEIRDSYRDIEHEIFIPSENLYQRVLDNIPLKAETSGASTAKNHWEQTKEFIKGLFSSRRVSWGVAAIQFAIILLLLVFPRGDGFNTLISKPSPTGEEIRINLIFDGESKEKEIREVLNRLGATIIKGPSPEGLYTIQTSGTPGGEEVLRELKKTKIVRFAERAF